MHQRMATIVVEVEMVKQPCSDLDRWVQALEKENRRLHSTVDFLSQQEPEKAQSTGDTSVRASTKSVQNNPAPGAMQDDWQEAVRHVVCSEKELEACQNNAVHAGMPDTIERDQVTYLSTPEKVELTSSFPLALLAQYL